MNKSKELVTDLVDEELLLEEVKVGWVLLQGSHDLIHFGSSNLKKTSSSFFIVRLGSVCYLVHIT